MASPSEITGWGKNYFMEISLKLMEKGEVGRASVSHPSVKGIDSYCTATSQEVEPLIICQICLIRKRQTNAVVPSGKFVHSPVLPSLLSPHFTLIC